MKRLRLSMFLPALFMLPILILSACSLGATPTDAAQPSQAVSQEVAATVAPVDLVGPQAGAQMYWADNSIFVYVPGGDFMMGADGVDGPVHKVALSPYWMQQSEVSNRQYQLCVQSGICTSLSDQDAQLALFNTTLADNPVVGVTWDQASTYCTWVNGALPTEAEWELAARGSEAKIYPWGDAEPTCDLLNFNNCLGKTTPIDNYPGGKSFYNVLDMSGNVFEWVRDWYDPEYYKVSPSQDPLGPDTGTNRSIRSSDYLSSAADSKPSKRTSMEPGRNRVNLGFRCVLEKPTPIAPACSTSGISTVSCPAVPFTGGSAQTCTPSSRVVRTTAGCNQNTGFASIQVTGDFQLGPGGDSSCSVSDNTVSCNGNGINTTLSICDPTPLSAPPGGATACPVGYYSNGSGCVFGGACPAGFVPGVHGCEIAAPVLVPVAGCEAPLVGVPGQGCVDPGSCSAPQVFLPGVGCVDTPACTPPNVFLPGQGCVSPSTIINCTLPNVYDPIRGCIDPINDVLNNCPVGLYNASGTFPAVCLPPEPIGCAVYHAATGRDCLADAFVKQGPSAPAQPAPAVHVSDPSLVPPDLMSSLNTHPNLPNLCPAGTYYDTGAQACVSPFTASARPGQMGTTASCLAGFSYNSAAMCCQGAAYNHCPTGQAMVGGVCKPVGGSPCSSVSISTSVCDGGSPGGENPGNPGNPGDPGNPGNPGNGCDADHPYTCTNGVCGCAPG